ncbi:MULTISPECIES: hypothetical protein [unclassified Flavobacterium]|uniref:hypothetical protein n=1 Tax=unclassified Flavobacterium TaxID=196869 RepID=UPI000F0C34CC|nr:MULTISPECIES: hypothetical protein [unclassified Flavobacterium]AYN04240.1 hypothetical protein EAG11_08595 [Flavobacterium sp. 140616W15]MCD0476235.1 hypothetical protein [Flavobacterium sp. EDS]
MKKIYLALAVIGLALGSCSKKVYNPYSDSEVVAHPTQGSVTLSGKGDEVENNRKDEGKSVAVKLAHKKALQQLFYFGFTGTDFKNPMIREGKSVEDKHKAYFDEFWNKGYERFVTNSSSTFYDCKGSKKCISAVSVFTVNYNMLRKEFENNKIINKIGF